MIAVSLVVIPLFAILCWQLWELDPEKYCLLVKTQGAPPGADCFNLLKEGLRIKGITIWGSLATLAAFVLVLLVYLAKTVISIVGPGNVQIKVGQREDSSGSDDSQ